MGNGQSRSALYAHYAKSNHISEEKRPQQFQFDSEDERISVLSSISVCDLSITLSLPLEVEYQDKNTYSCVLNNPISNQTTHLDINTLCHTCAGVFAAETNEIQSVSVMEGDSVTLNSDVTEIREDEDILWKYGAEKSLIAKISIETRFFSTFDDVPDGRFRDRLKLDNQTGSLTITNTTTEHTGDYQLEKSGVKLTIKSFSVSVYGISVLSSISVCDLSISLSLPLEVEYQDKNTYSCVLNNPISNQTTHLDINTLCHTCAGISVLSSISVCDLSISLSLPLEVEYQDKNTYSCVLNNPISNQTTHLDINTLCHTCAVPPVSVSLIVLISAGSLMIVAGFGIFWICWKHRKTDPKGNYYF
ncbi:unnamed protein product [Leuciscus chuanchicus]